mgnify:CR=1 FL=1
MIIPGPLFFMCAGVSCLLHRDVILDLVIGPFLDSLDLHDILGFLVGAAVDDRLGFHLADFREAIQQSHIFLLRGAPFLGFTPEKNRWPREDFEATYHSFPMNFDYYFLGASFAAGLGGFSALGGAFTSTDTAIIL